MFVCLCLLEPPSADELVRNLRSGPTALRTQYPTPLQLWSPTLYAIAEEPEEGDKETAPNHSGIHHSAATHTLKNHFSEHRLTACLENL